MYLCSLLIGLEAETSLGLLDSLKNSLIVLTHAYEYIYRVVFISVWIENQAIRRGTKAAASRSMISVGFR